VLFTSVTGYWLRILAPNDLLVQDFTLGPLPIGTNVYANISLNEVNTYFTPDSVEPKFSAAGYIPYWTTYRDDGTESEYEGMGFNQNAVAINNCARITFALQGKHVAATAQVNVFFY
jgi:hypothetical protein